MRHEGTVTMIALGAVPLGWDPGLIDHGASASRGHIFLPARKLLKGCLCIKGVNLSGRNCDGPGWENSTCI